MYLYFFNCDLFWITLISFSIVFPSIIIFLIKKFSKLKNTNNLIFQLSLPVSLSATSLYIVFLGYHFFPSDNSIFAKLTSGEVIVGIAIASPSLYMWYINNQERNIDKAFDSLNKEYIDWLGAIKGDSKLADINHAKLRVLLDKEKAYYKMSNNLNNFNPIDWDILFLSIQDKIRDSYSSKNNKLSNDYFNSWREINSLIIEEREIELNKDEILKLPEVYAIDFQKNEEFLRKFTHAISFTGCAFKYDNLKALSEDNPITVEWSVLDKRLTPNEKQVMSETIVKSYFFTDDITEEVKEDEILNRNLDCFIPYTGNKVEIFENRDLSDRGAINYYILGNQAYNIVVSSETSNLKKSLYNKLTSVLKKNGQNIDDRTYSLSKSKNFIPNMKNSDSWVWHSWNVLNKEKADDEEIKYFIFAINVEGEKYSCIILEREKLQELIQYKILSKDNRYFFYFAEKKF